MSTYFFIFSMTVFSGKVIAIEANTYLGLKESEQGWFLLGLISGLKETVHQESKAANATENCTKGMPLKQVHAITAKYLAKNPEHWHHEMTEIYKKAINPVCKN